MKKIVLTVFLFSVLSAGMRAEAFKIGENIASFGLGLGWKNKEAYNSAVNFPSPNAFVERSILPFKNLGFLSVGAQFGLHYSFHKDEISGRQSWTEVYFLPRLSLYFHELFYEEGFPENIDLYGGIGLGFNLLSHNHPADDSDTRFRLGYNFFVGARYHFDNKNSAFAEIGYGLSFLNVGLSIRY